MLIIGGLICIGILALIAAFFVMRDPKGAKGETRAERKRQTDKHKAVETPAVQEPASTAIQAPEETTTMLQVPQTVPVTPTPPQSTSTGPRNMPELLAELQLLHQQSADIERRLNHLTDLVERLQPTLVGVPNVHSKRTN